MTEKNGGTTTGVELNKNVVEVLTGVTDKKRSGQLRLNALVLIHRGPPAYEDIIKACLPRTRYPTVLNDWEDVAAVVKATAIHNPQDAHKWLKFLWDLFFKEVDEKPNPTLDMVLSQRWSDKIYSPFVQGIALGIFETMCWLDKEWRTKTEFESEVPIFIGNLILCQNSLMKSTHQESPRSIYENQLSQAIKRYVRHDTWGCNFVGHTGRRINQVRSIYGVIDPEFQKKDFTPTPLGELVAKQLNYAFFGSISTGNQIHSISLIFDSFASFDYSLEPSQNF